jgi:Flp pilus assembly pilin Flp
MGETLKRKRFDEGASTVEYALLTLAAAAVAGAMVAVAKSEAFMAALSSVVLKALG